MVLENREYGKKSRRQQCVSLCIEYTNKLPVSYANFYKLRDALSFIYKR